MTGGGRVVVYESYRNIYTFDRRRHWGRRIRRNIGFAQLAMDNLDYDTADGKLVANADIDGDYYQKQGIEGHMLSKPQMLTSPYFGIDDVILVSNEIAPFQMFRNDSRNMPGSYKLSLTGAKLQIAVNAIEGLNYVYTAEETK